MKILMSRLKFWGAVLEYATKHFKEAHLDEHHNDIKCPQCNEWFSVSGLKYKHEHREDLEFNRDLYVAECGQCGYISLWNMSIAPFPVLVDSNGNFYKTGE